jgi:hypothetical protein
VRVILNSAFICRSVPFPPTALCVTERRDESWDIITNGTGSYRNGRNPDTRTDVPTPPSEHIPDEAKEQEPDAEERAKEVCSSDSGSIVTLSIVWGVLTGVQSWRSRGSSLFLPRRET